MHNDILGPFSEAVESIHTAALQPDAWPQAMRQIAALQRAPRALLFTPELAPQAGGFTMAHEVSDAFLAEWGSRYLAHDVWTAQGRRLGAMRDGNVVFGVELVPDAELIETVFYREFLSRQQIRRLCTGIVFAGQRPGQPLTVCSAFRSSACADFDETDRRVHALLTTHLSRAVGTMLRLRDAEFRLASSLQALDRLHGALLLLGRRGNVLFANRKALALLAPAQGLALRAGHPLQDGVGWLQATRAELQNALDAEIRAALANDPLRPAHFAHGLCIPPPRHKANGWCRPCRWPSGTWRGAARSNRAPSSSSPTRRPRRRSMPRCCAACTASAPPNAAWRRSCCAARPCRRRPGSCTWARTPSRPTCTSCSRKPAPTASRNSSACC